MSADKISNHVVKELAKQFQLEEEPGLAEKLLLGCGYQKIIRNIMEQAKDYAKSEGLSVIEPKHIEAAKDAWMQETEEKR
ncbi:LAQU0S04e01706g1_1 [Lachancea quebecensis]|uniref:LAQU0S04e01706g1_1 n=1 Tax=Lachancea quebecensis TaxID=1654605 RepID=A0A0P1KQD0_9SACH|nr:LAQU0S04e01706g1_1 [Lachancea quebecensis]